MTRLPCGCLLADLGGLMAEMGCREHLVNGGAMPKAKQWALQNVETGAYLGGIGCKWAWGLEPYERCDSYHAAARCLVQQLPADIARDAHIVEAPPKEMTDPETWAWFTDNAQDLVLIGDSPADFGVYRLDALMRGTTTRTGRGTTPCDAIRAARRALEAKR